MAGKRIPPAVENAITNVRAVKEAGIPGWDISIRNEKIGFTAPDGVKLTIGMSPNDESLKKFVREATKYNLIVGPPRTPAESEALLAEAEAASQKEADRRNAERKRFEAEQRAKREAAEAAAVKAAKVTARGMEPKVETEYTPSGFPKVFDASLLGVMEYAKFRLPSGRYFCIECLDDTNGDRVEASFKAPQGLATHRGFRHQMYQTNASIPQVPGAVAADVSTGLPEEIRTALDLLAVTVAEHLTADPTDSERVVKLEADLATIRKQAEADLNQADRQYNEAKETFDKALRVEKEKVHKHAQELSGLQGTHQAEIEGLMTGFKGLLARISKIIQDERPVQAVSKIDELLEQYLNG